MGRKLVQKENIIKNNNTSKIDKLYKKFKKHLKILKINSRKMVIELKKRNLTLKKENDENMCKMNGIKDGIQDKIIVIDENFDNIETIF